MSVFECAMITAAFIVFCALWRLWLGGVPNDYVLKFPLGYLQYPVALAVVGWFVYAHTGNPWLAGVNALCFLAFWRALGHGPMLGYPLGDDPDDKLIVLLYRYGLMWRYWFWDKNAKAWWAYAEIRYGFAAFLWCGVNAWFGLETWPILYAGALVPVPYRVLANLRRGFGWVKYAGGVPKDSALSASLDGYHDEWPHVYIEPIAGAIVGAALALTFQ